MSIRTNCGVRMKTRGIAVGDDVVHAGPDHEDQVRFAEGGGARGEKAERVVLADHPSALGRREEGNSETLDEGLEGRFRLRPENASSRDDDGSLRRLEPAKEVGDRFGRKTRAVAVPAVRRSLPGDVVLLDRGVEHISRKVEVHRPGLARHGAFERAVDELRDPAWIVHPLGPFRGGLHHRELIDLLKRAAPARSERSGPTERDHRHAIGPGMGNPGDEIGGAGSGRRHADPGAIANAGPRMGHHRRGLFVAHVDPADPFGHGGGFRRHHRAAHEVEEALDALALERLRENFRSDESHFRSSTRDWDSYT